MIGQIGIRCLGKVTSAVNVARSYKDKDEGRILDQVEIGCPGEDPFVGDVARREMCYMNVSCGKTLRRKEIRRRKGRVILIGKKKTRWKGDH